MKRCKGNNKAANYNGCGSLIERAFKYGLCRPCYTKWLFETDEGRKRLNWVKSNWMEKSMTICLNIAGIQVNG